MSRYNVIISKKAIEDLAKLKSCGLSKKAKSICDILAQDPLQPPYKKLVGDLNGKYSRRINIKHRIIYEIIEDTKTVKVLRMWTHYE